MLNGFSDLRTLWHSYRCHLAWLQASAQRPLTPSPKHIPNKWERSSSQVSHPDCRRNCPAHVPSQSKPGKTTHGERSPCSSLFWRKSKAQKHSNVSHIPIKGGTREEEEGRKSECPYKRKCAKDCRRSGGLQWYLCEQRHGRGWGWLRAEADIDMGHRAYSPCIQQHSGLILNHQALGRSRIMWESHLNHSAEDMQVQVDQVVASRNKSNDSHSQPRGMVNRRKQGYRNESNLERQTDMSNSE